MEMKYDRRFSLLRERLCEMYAFGAPIDEINNRLFNINRGEALYAKKPFLERVDITLFFDEFLSACILTAAGAGRIISASVPHFSYFAAADQRLLRLAAAEMLRAALRTGRNVKISVNAEKNFFSIKVNAAQKIRLPVSRACADLHGGRLYFENDHASLRIPANLPGENGRVKLIGEYLEDQFSVSALLMLNLRNGTETIPCNFVRKADLSAGDAFVLASDLPQQPYP